MSFYETNSALSEYLLLHYGRAEDSLPYEFGPRDALAFPLRTVSENIHKTGKRALDLGCAVGRSSFELAKHFESVIGIDYSQSFIDAANSIKSSGSLEFRVKQEGDNFSNVTGTVPAEIDRERVEFLCADAEDLPTDLGSFDVLHVANLVCRLRDPSTFVKKLPDMLNPGGQLVLCTPCTWLEEYTPKDNWLPQNGKTTLEAITERLELERGEVKDTPMLIRETARKYQWTVVQVSNWFKA